MTALFLDRTWTSADGLTLHARDYAAAAGPARLPVLCLHGLTRNARDFEDVAPAIAAQGRRVLALDTRGRGGSAWDPAPGNYHIGTYAPDVVALLDALGIARAVFVGTSMGGLITMMVSATRPGAVAAAVLNDIGPGLTPEGMARIGGYVGIDPEVKDWTGAADYAARISAHAHPQYGPQEWDAFARRTFAERDGRPMLDYDPAIAGLAKLPEGAPPPDLWPLFNLFKDGRPILVVRGALSDLFPAASVTAMREAAPDLEDVEVPGVGHAPMLTEPAAASALQAFLDRVD